MTQETENTFVAVTQGDVAIGIDWQAVPVLSLKIGRTGEKAKYQGRTIEMDLRKLPVESVRFALEYGLRQYIADGGAGPADQGQSAYDMGLDARIKKLAEGDFTREAGERGPRVETAEGLALKNAAAAIRAHLGTKGVKAEAKVITEAARKQVEANPKWLAEAKASLAASAKLAETLDLGDLFENLTGVGDHDTDEG